jgi:hypothetical protein
VRLIGILLVAALLAVALWLVFHTQMLRGGYTAPNAMAPSAAPAVANTTAQNAMADDAAAQKADAAAKAKAAKAKAEALAAERAVEAAQANAIEQNMTPAQNRLNEDYAAQVGDTRPATPGAGDNKTPPN